MDKNTLDLLNELNRAIIKFRGIYSSWSKMQKISYNEMLVLYTIREYGFCTQKKICDNYLLPRQTINNIIQSLKERKILEVSKELPTGREKAFVLTEKGNQYAQAFFESLNGVEEKAVELLTPGKLKELTRLMLEYDAALTKALEG